MKNGRTLGRSAAGTGDIRTEISTVFYRACAPASSGKFAATRHYRRWFGLAFG